MGLDTSHDAYHGGYSHFNEWRRKICELAGFPPLKEMYGFGGTNQWYETKGDVRLIPLLDHSDCDGDLTPVECKFIADGLSALLPALETAAATDKEDTEEAYQAKWLLDTTKLYRWL